MADDDNNVYTTSLFTIGSEVEVSSDEPGFDGAWYVATILDIIEKNPKKTNSKGFSVKYHALLVDDNSTERLTELVYGNNIRPLPPPEYSCGDDGFEVGDVIDAFHKDGWWMGVVKKVKNEHLSRWKTKYVVEFKDPHEELEFKRSKLRIHVDWVDSRWKLLPKKTPMKLRSAGKIDAQTSESNNEAQSGFITPYKGPRDLDHISSHSSKRLTRSQTRAVASNSKAICAVDGSPTNSRNRTTVLSNLGSEGSRKRTMHAVETSGSRAINPDLPLVEYGARTAETSGEDNGTSQKRKRGRPRKLPINENNSQEGTEETRKRSPSRGTTTDLDDVPLSSCNQGLLPQSLLKRCSCNSPCEHRGESSGPPIQTSVNNGETNDYQQQWPFIKQSPFWARVKCLELYPQKPHFTPLKEHEQFYRECLAMAFTSSFEDMLRRVSSLQLTDPVDMINKILEFLVVLESHGFYVRPMRERLNELLNCKDNLGQLEDKLENLKKDITKRNYEKSVVEEETSQFEAQINDLNEKVAKNVKTLCVKNEELNKFIASKDQVCNQIMDLKNAFEKLAATPL